MTGWRRAPERPWRAVAPGTVALFALLLGLHAAWHSSLPPRLATAHALPTPPSVTVARVTALGDPLVLAKWYTLWLQAFDDQAGTAIAFTDLDYGRLTAWLELALALDPRAQYPLLVASRLYAEVHDPARSRQMLEFVARAFADDPARRWPWLAHAVFVARHRLHDQSLALRFARALAAADIPEIPHWARQLEIFALEDMGEIAAARILLGGLLASGQITDPHEQRWLSARLQAMEDAAQRGP